VKRTEKHRDVKRIMRAIDRAIASPYATCDGLAPRVIEGILDPGLISSHYDSWTHEGMRAVVLANAIHAPADELRDMAANADERLEWVEWWERNGWIESEMPVKSDCSLMVDMYAQLIEAGREPAKARAVVERAIERMRMEQPEKPTPAEVAVH
jgi:hypothetical protein